MLELNLEISKYKKSHKIKRSHEHFHTFKLVMNKRASENHMQ